MASFDTRIKVFLDAQQAYKEIAKLEKNLNKINDAATRAQGKVLLETTKARVKQSEKELSNQVKLTAAKERQAALEKSIKRAGVSGGRSDEVTNLLKVAKAAEDNLTIRNAVNAALEKTLQTQREINRTDAAQNATRSKVTTDIKNRIAALRAVGATESEINEIVEKRSELIKQNDKKQTDLARESVRKIDRQLTTLEKKYSTFLNPTKQAASPIGGSKTLPGSPAFLAAQEQAFAKERNAQRSREKSYEKLFRDAEKIRQAFRVDKQALKLRELSYQKLFREAQKIREAFPKPQEQNLGLPALPAAGQSSFKRMQAASKQAVQQEKAATAELKKQEQLQNRRVKRDLERLNTVSRFQKFLREGNEILQKNAALTAKEAKDNKNQVNSLKNQVKELKNKNKELKTATRESKKAKSGSSGQSKAPGALERALQGAILGGGFPFLFAGPSFSAAGGALGGGLGGLRNQQTGFAGGIALSALGAALDGLIKSTLETGRTFQKLTRNVNDFIPKLGRGAGDGFGGTAEFLTEQGRASEVATAAQQRYIDVYGKDAVKRLEKLAETTKKWDQTMAELGVKMQDFISGPLAGLLAAIQKVTGTGDGDFSPAEGAKKRFEDKAAGLQPQIDALEALPKRSFFEQEQLNKLLAEQNGYLAVASKYQDEINGKVQNRTTLESILTDVLERQAKEQEGATALVRDRLTARRDTFASQKGEQEILVARNKLEVAQKQLREEENRTVKDTALILKLQTQEKQLQGDLDRSQLERANQILEAQRQITREVVQTNIQTEQAAQRILATETQLSDIQRTALERITSRIQLLAEDVQTRTQILEQERQLALLGVIEQEKITAINQLYDNKLLQIQKEAELKAELARQDELAIQRQARLVNDQILLNRLREEQRAEEAIRQTSPQYANSFASQGLGFFGDSAKAESDILARTAARIEEFNTRIANAQRELDKAVDTETDKKVVKTLARDVVQLKDARDAFARAQEQIDAAAIAQAKYNDALKFTAPAAALLTNALRDVVTGAASAQEALANIFNGLSDIFLSKATELISKFAAEGITNLLTDGAKAATDAAAETAKATAEAAAIGTAVTAANAPLLTVNSLLATAITANTAALSANTIALNIPKLASGGTASAGGLHIVGEEGPELFVPGVTGTVVAADQFEAAKEALSENAAAFGDSTVALETASSTRAANQSAAAEASAMQTAETYFAGGKSTVSFDTYRVGEMDVVTREDAMKIGMESAKQAEANVYKGLRNMPAIRGRSGVK